MLRAERKKKKKVAGIRRHKQKISATRRCGAPWICEQEPCITPHIRCRLQKCAETSAENRKRVRVLVSEVKKRQKFNVEAVASRINPKKKKSHFTTRLLVGFPTVLPHNLSTPDRSRLIFHRLLRKTKASSLRDVVEDGACLVTDDPKITHIVQGPCTATGLHWDAVFGMDVVVGMGSTFAI